jgi:hypothetical protein
MPESVNTDTRTFYKIGIFQLFVKTYKILICCPWYTSIPSFVQTTSRVVRLIDDPRHAVYWIRR